MYHWYWLIFKGRYPREVSLNVIIKQVSVWLSLIIKLFHHFSPNLSKSTHDSPDQTDDRIKIWCNLRSSHPTPPWLPSALNRVPTKKKEKQLAFPNSSSVVMVCRENVEVKTAVAHRSADHRHRRRKQSVLANKKTSTPSTSDRSTKTKTTNLNLAQGKKIDARRTVTS